MSDERREFRGVWFPAEVWLDKRLTALEKIILIEIDSLDGEDGCYASNEYLAEFCQCSQSKVSSAIAKLKKLGYIRVKSFDGRKRILESCLSFSVMQTPKKKESDSQNLEERILVESTSKSTNKYASEGPTLDEVRAYVAEKGYHFDAEHFHEYYSASGWRMQSGKPVKSWRQCCVTWERNWKGERHAGEVPESLRAYDF